MKPIAFKERYEVDIAVPYRLHLIRPCGRRASTRVFQQLRTLACNLIMITRAGPQNAAARKPSCADNLGAGRKPGRGELDLAAHDHRVECGGRARRHRDPPFPSIESFEGAGDDVLLTAGLSTNKLAALRRVADALLSGVLDEASLVEGQPSPDAAARLCRIKGIGPWTATVILLRGLGRLDVFPMNDSSVARNFAFVSGSVPLDIDRVLTAPGSQRGMLYCHLLLARLDARGDVGRASSTLLRSVQSQAQRHHRRGS